MIFLGAILSVIWAGSALMFKYSDINIDLGKFYETLASMRPEALRKKARRHLLLHPRLQALQPLNLPLGIIFAIGTSAVFKESHGEVLLGHGIGLAASVTLMLTTGPKMMGWRIRAFAQVAAQMVARKFPPAEAVPLLMEASHRPHPYQRIAAAYGLAEFPRGQAYQRLSELTADHNPDVARLALQKFNQLGRWRAAAEKGKVVVPLEIRGRASEAPSPISTTPNPQFRSRAQQEEEERQMMPVLIQQSELKWHFPHLFCKKCMARARIQGTGEWMWVMCRVCGEVDHIITQVKCVIGVLDGHYSWELNPLGELRIGLWDESQKTVRPADLDMLEVAPVEGVDTNWALSATMAAMEARPPGWEIVVTDPSILSENSRRMLEAHQKK